MPRLILIPPLKPLSDLPANRSQRRATALSRRRAELVQFLVDNKLAPPDFDPKAPRPGEPAVLEGMRTVIVDSSAVNVAALRESGVTVVFDGPIELNRGTPAWVGFEPRDDAHKRAIHLAAAGPLTGKDVLIGMLDMPVAVDHPEIRGKLSRYQAFDDGQEIPWPLEVSDAHGTMVAGLLVSARCGIAPGARLAVAGISPDFATGFPIGMKAAVFRAADWLIKTQFPDRSEAGCDVLNFSMGNHQIPCDCWLYKSLEGAAADYSLLVVAAIGNSGQRGENVEDAPGSYEAVLGVGAIEKHKERIAPMTSYGAACRDCTTESEHGSLSGSQKPDLIAPGVAVWTTIPRLETGETFGADIGTSYASPIVAGAAALLIEREPTLKDDPGRLKTLLTKVTRPVPGVNRPDSRCLDFEVLSKLT